MTAPFKRNQEVDLTIDDLAFGGQGLARVNDFIVFFQRSGTPGERVKARIKKIKGNYAEARIESVLAKSPLEIAPPCPYFRYCGGCRFQNLPYERQLEFLTRQVVELYQHLGGFRNVPIHPIIPAESIYRYRNKMEFAFSDRRWLFPEDDLSRPADFALGLRTPDNYYKAVDIDDCLIAPEESATIIRLVRDFARQNNLAPYNFQYHKGYLRHLVVRKGVLTNQIMINFVTAADSPGMLRPLVDILMENLKNVCSIINTVTRSVSGTTTGEITHLLAGQPYITDKIGDLTLKISPESFFQTNTRMANRLYDVIRQFARPEAHQIIWDLYCGAGSIALFLAHDCRKVIGLEIAAAAIADAQENASRNAITNADFMTVNLEKCCGSEPSLLQNLPAPDTIIVDPPRGGLTPPLIVEMLNIRPARIIYISCNPASQVRDLKELTADGFYRITNVQPLDLFPHTPHIEVVTALERQ
ncbi:MAG: 23S rRNA (uracil(1939)-C(5))-methyltransferase RlmD [Candidatus Neomarinimicrobiota bacterium]